jgi:CRISPR-associated protein Cas1
MASQPIPILPPNQDSERARLPEYLPARMVNEYVYCPRLFFYEWVDGVFVESSDTVEGSHQHRRVDAGTGALPAAEELAPEDRLRTRAVTLSSDRYRLIAKMDLLEIAEGEATPVDYKRGRPCETPDGDLTAWPADRVQLAVQAIVLRENGFAANEGILFYAATKQRVRVVFDDTTIGEALLAAEEAWQLAKVGKRPAPLEDSPKCPRCSFVGVCLPDETNRLATAPESVQLSLFDILNDGPTPKKPAAPATPRAMVAPRSDKKPVYLNTQGLRVGKSGEVLQMREKDSVVQEARLREINQINLMGNVQISTQALQALFESEVPVCFFSQGGWFYGIGSGLTTKNVFLRRTQFRLADHEGFCLRLARQLIAGKIRNQRTLLQRNHLEPPALVLRRMKELAEDAEKTESLEELLGVEGMAARHYFSEFSQMLKAGEAGDQASEMSFDFERRNRRPPRDPVNALLSLAYSMLAKDLTVACAAVGLDPMLGFLHQPRFGRPALALDLMEPFRPLIADSAVLSAVNTRMVTLRDFVQAGPSVALTPGGRKGFFRAYELRMDTLVTHPQFDYRVSYRRVLEIQVRLLARYLEGETGSYPVFLTR